MPPQRRQLVSRRASPFPLYNIHRGQIHADADGDRFVVFALKVHSLVVGCLWNAPPTLHPVELSFPTRSLPAFPVQRKTTRPVYYSVAYQYNTSHSQVTREQTSYST